MIGLIPFLVDDFMARQYGDPVRRETLVSLNMAPDFSFNIAQAYDDELCRRVITAMALRIGLPFPVLYDRLGEHFLNWILTNLGGMFEDIAETIGFLCRLPAIYNSFGGSVVGAGLPGVSELVTVRRSGQRLRMTYQSQARFAEFFVSFMKAVGQHFDQPISITIVAGDVDAPFCIFDVEVTGREQISRQPVASGTPLESASAHAG